MKKQMLVVALGLGAIALAATANAGTKPGTGIRGSLHDLSTVTYGQNSPLVEGGAYGTLGITGGTKAGITSVDSLQRVCIFCHAPHNTQRVSGTLAYSPLWNKTLTTQTYTLYNNGLGDGAGLLERHKLNAQQENANFNNLTKKDTITGISVLCLSCHDGSVALNAYGSSLMDDSRSYSAGNTFLGNNVTSATTTNAGAFLIGGQGDLTNHHPIGFNYKMVAAKDWEIAPVETEFPNSKVKIGEVLFNDNMECSTCHDVHNSHGGMGEKLLWTSDANSSFCCTCHLKCANKVPFDGHNYGTFNTTTQSATASTVTNITNVDSMTGANTASHTQNP